MKKIEIEQSSKAVYSNQPGLALVGALVNDHTTLSQQLDAAGGHPKIPHKDVVKTYLGVLAMGKSDFEAVLGVSKDACRSDNRKLTICDNRILTTLSHASLRMRRGASSSFHPCVNCRRNEGSP